MAEHKKLTVTLLSRFGRSQKGGGLWSAVQISRLRDSVQSVETTLKTRSTEFQERNSELSRALQTEQNRNTQLEQEVANLQKIQTPDPYPLPAQILPDLLIANLASGQSRSSDSRQEINIPSGIEWVHFDLKMDPLEYPQYQVTLQRVGGEIIRNQTESSVQGYFPGFIISAELLTRGNYEIKLTGITAAGDDEDIGIYGFWVNPK